MGRNEYSFGPFFVDPNSYVLRCGTRPVALQPRVFELLLAFLRSGGRLVRKDELTRTVWPDQFVSENSLAKAISELRAALRKHASVEVIRTVPSVGYKFTLAVREHSIEAETAVPAAQNADIRLLILPFEIAAKTERDHEARLLCDEITALLSAADLKSDKRLTVINGAACGRLGLTRDEIFRRCEPTHVLQGSVNVSPRAARIAIELVTASQESLGGEVTEVKGNDALAQQRVMAEKAAALAVRKLREENERDGSSSGGTKAFDAYSKALYFWKQRTVEGLKQAAHFASQAIALDPRFAVAYVKLANCYAALISHGEGIPIQLLRRAREAAERAMELNPNLAEAYVAMGNLDVLFELDWVSAEANYQRAIQLRPRYATAHHWYGNALLAAGLLQEGIGHLEQAFLLQPHSLSIRTARAQGYYLAGMYHECHEQVRDMLDMNPGFAPAYFALGMIHGVTGNSAESLAGFRRAVQLAGGHPFYVASLAYGHIRWGQRRQARKMLDHLQALAKRRYVSAYDLALLQCNLGQEKQAIANFQQAHENRDALLMWLNTDPRLEEQRRSGVLDSVLRHFRFPARARAAAAD